MFQNKISSNMFRYKGMNFPCWTGLTCLFFFMQHSEISADSERLQVRIAIRISLCVFEFSITFQSHTFIVDEEGTRPCITAVLEDHVLLTKFLTIFPSPIYNSFVHEIVFEIVSNCFSRSRWIVPTSWNLKRIE